MSWHGPCAPRLWCQVFLALARLSPADAILEINIARDSETGFYGNRVQYREISLHSRLAPKISLVGRAFDTCFTSFRCFLYPIPKGQ
ncbi:hypothetical protein ABIC60_003283 [Phyllobacterium ifriqiyense]